MTEPHDAIKEFATGADPWKLVDQLRATLGKMEVALGAINDAIVWTDQAGVVQWCNAPFGRLIGKSHLQLLGAPLVGLLPLDRGGQPLAASVHPVTVALASGASSEEVYEFRRDDRRLVLEVSVTPVQFGDPPRSIVVVLYDVTKRMEIEEALRQSEERFRQLAEATFEGVAISEEGKIVDVNQALAAMFGCAPSEMIGRPGIEFVAPASRQIASERIRAGDEKPYEVIGLRKDGSTFSMEVCGKSISYRGRPARVAAIRDITERKRIEETLRREKAQLEAMNQMMIGREVRMVELKQEVNALLAELGRPKKYDW